MRRERSKGARLGAFVLLAATLWPATTALLQAAESAQPGSSQGASARPVRLQPRAYGDHPTIAQLTELGRKVFFDASLSASGKMSCATCHDPEHAFGPADRQPVQFGGADLRAAGTRSVPTLRYLVTTVAFDEHFFDDDDTGGVDAGPTGGLTWDGRVNTLHEQARIPLLAAHEMGNANAADIADRLRKARYAEDFRKAFSAPGHDVLDEPEQALGWLAMALEVFQQSPGEFYPFTSKYDAFLRHQAGLSEREIRGMALFMNPEKGNCAGCHPNNIKASGAFPLFTDSGFIALGVPRNPDIPANREAGYYDLGLCGPVRTDFANSADYCGRFKTPTLRNAATRTSFFHNGRFHALKEVVEFYALRDVSPERFYPVGTDGKVDKFDDLPAAYRGNVNAEAPFAPAEPGKPRLDAADIDDIVAFIETLTDGYEPGPSTKKAQR